MKPVEAQTVVGPTASSEYERLATDRLPALERARRASALTIPSLIPPEGATQASQFPEPYQSIGAQGSKTLAAKLLLALFPPGTSFFRYSIDDFVLEELKQKQGAEGFDDARAEFETALGKIERSITTRLEQVGARTQLWELLLHLVVGGNGLLQILKGARLKFFPLSQYVCKRDLEGNVLKVITKETLTRESLPEEARALIAGRKNNGEMCGENEKQEEDVYLFTVCVRDSGVWRLHQEICGQIVPKSQSTFPLDKSAMLPLRWTAVSGSDYGRGHVEEHFGDLESLESLTQSNVDFAAIAARIIHFVKEGGPTDKNALARARSGDYLDGDAKDVSTLLLEKYADFQVAKAVMDEITPRVRAAFLMNSAVQRNAERVTAEEIRFMAQELEQVLGGVYSVLAQELQLPLVKRVMFVMQRERALPFLPDKTVVPQIVTGLDGLGRTSDFNKLQTFLADCLQTFGEQAVNEWIDVGDVLKRKAAALGIDTTGMVRTAEQVQQARMAAQKQAMMEKMGPKLADLTAKGAELQSQSTSQQGTK